MLHGHRLTDPRTAIYRTTQNSVNSKQSASLARIARQSIMEKGHCTGRSYPDANGDARRTSRTALRLGGHLPVAVVWSEAAR